MVATCPKLRDSNILRSMLSANSKLGYEISSGTKERLKYKTYRNVVHTVALYGFEG